MNKRPNKPLVFAPEPANDNDGAMTATVSYDLPTRLGIISGEAELIARYLPELLRTAANDNEVE